MSSFRFGRHELRPAERALLSDGQIVRLGARAFDILLALVERRDRLVGFDELLDIVWPGLAVEENNLSVHVSMLRKVLGPDVITTVRGRGYRFTAPLDAAPAQSLVAPSDVGGFGAPPPNEWTLRPAVAILPFASPSIGASSMGIGDVLTDQLISVLSSSAMLNVISRLSTASFRDRSTPLPRISALLSANFIVSGSCWTDGDVVMANVELADARSQGVLWSRTVSDTTAGVLRQDSDLVLNVAGAITQAIYQAELRTAHKQSFPDLASHTLLLVAIGLLYRLSRLEFERAREALAILHERAPHHALPLAWQARWHLFRVVQGWSEDRDKDGRQAHDLARRALDADPTSSLALTMLGNVHTSYLRDLDTAEALYARATGENPNESLAWLQWGNARSFRGDGVAALSHAERAVRLSPLDPARHFYDSIFASAALTAGEHDRAIEAARASLSLNDDHVSTHRVLAIALSLAGRLEEARAEVRRILELEPALTVETFIARSPGDKSGLAHRFGRALQDAGLPP